MLMNPVYLAFGSNLGDREEYLRAGMRGLSARGINIIRCASLYSTEPLEILDQPWFLNTVLVAGTDFGPDELLRTCMEVEKENNRLRDQSKSPRTLDIDIIFYGNRIIETPNLVVPHPSFVARRFVLVPLAEIAADFIDPRTGKTVQQLLQICPDRSSVVLHAPSPDRATTQRQ